MIVLIIILCVLAFSLLQPLRVKINFEEELSFKVYYSLIPVFSYPKAEPKQEDEAETSEDEPQEEEKNEENGEGTLGKLKKIIRQTGLKGFLNLIYELLKIVLSGGNRLVRRIKLTDADIYICSTDDNAADAAYGYGKLCAAVYPAVSAIYSFFRCKKGKVTVDVDYDAEDTVIKAYASLRITSLFALAIVIKMIFGALPRIIKVLKTVKKGNKNERESKQSA